MEEPVVPVRNQIERSISLEKGNNSRGIPAFSFLSELAEHNCTICVITLVPCSLIGYTICFGGKKPTRFYIQMENAENVYILIFF